MAKQSYIVSGKHEFLKVKPIECENEEKEG